MILLEFNQPEKKNSGEIGNEYKEDFHNFTFI